MKRKIKKAFQYIYVNISKPEMNVLPGHLAFYFLMMLIPLLTLLGSLLTTINFVGASITEVMYNNLPENIADMIIMISKQESSNVSLWMLLIPTLLLASNGTYSMIITSNSIYKVKNASYFFNRVKAFIMLILLIILFLFLLLVPTFGNTIFRIIGTIITNSNITDNLSFLLFKVLKYPLTFFAVYLAVKILYIMAPNIKIEKKQVTFGAMFTSIMWVISTWIYSYYIEYMSSYETFYGGISGFLFLILWIYVLSYIFVLGMAMNASRYEIDKESTSL